MDVLGLTSFSQIRGVLAVSDADLPDEIMLPYAVEEDLEDDLAAWLPSWQTVRDSGDAAHKRKLRLYAKYQCAALVAVAGQNFMFTRMTDGFNDGQRSDREGYQTLRRHLERRAAEIRAQLVEVLLPQAEAASRPPAMGVANPARDPVTEGRS